METIILTHWVKEEFKKKVMKKEIPDELVASHLTALRKQGFMKPVGIWLSVNNSWENWLEGNWDEWKFGKVCLLADLSFDTNLFIIDSKEKFLDEFLKLTGEKYGYDGMIPTKEDYMKKLRMIDKFHLELRKKYDGIWLKAAPFYAHRLDLDFDYFYPWDCESICVWNTDKITFTESKTEEKEIK